MTEQPALDLGPIDAPKRRPVAAGKSTRAVRQQLAAWAEAGHLVGNVHAATRETLLSAAQAVDVAQATLVRPACAACGAPVRNAYVGNPGRLASTNRILAELLAAAAPAHGLADGPDPYGQGGDDDGAFRIPADWLSPPTAGDALGH